MIGSMFRRLIGSTGGVMGINGKALLQLRIDAELKQGETELWRVSAPMMIHPFHVHGCSFQVVSRAGQPVDPRSEGHKDVVVVDRDYMLSSALMADRTGMSCQAVHNAAPEGRLLAINGAKRGLNFPGSQINENGVPRTGLVEVLSAVGNGWTAHRFFMATMDGTMNRAPPSPSLPS